MHKLTMTRTMSKASGLFKKLIQISECSWNHEYFWSGSTLTLQETRSIHDAMNIPKIEFIAYIYLLSKYLKYKKITLGIKTVLYLKYNRINGLVGV